MIALLRRNFTLSRIESSSSPSQSHSAFLLYFSTAIYPALYELLVNKHHFSPKPASQIASVVTRLKNPQNPDAVISFLKEIGFSVPQLEKMFKCKPQLLSAGVEKTIKPKIKTFHDFGLSMTDLVEIFTKNPWILTTSINQRIIPSLTALMSVLDANELAEILKLSTILLRPVFYNNVVPNVEFLKKCGVSMDQIIWMLQRFPRFVGGKPEDIKRFVLKADEIGARRTSKKFIHCVRTFSSMSDKTWETKRRYLERLGFSSDDIAAAFRKFPWVFGFSVGTWTAKMRTLREVGFLDDDITRVLRNFPAVFCLSEEKIKGVKEVLVATGKYDVCSIVGMPLCLTLSLEKRYKPRLEVLELLNGKNLIRSWPALTTFTVMPNQKFYDKFVAPFGDELGELCMAKWAAVLKEGNGVI